MGQIYVGQTALRLRFDTNQDLTDVATATIKYLKPDGVPGSFAGTIESPASSGYVHYDIESASDLDKAGDWKFWIYVILNDDTVAPGEAATIPVYEQGQ